MHYNVINGNHFKKQNHFFLVSYIILLPIEVEKVRYKHPPTLKKSYL